MTVTQLVKLLSSQAYISIKRWNVDMDTLPSYYIDTPTIYCKDGYNFRVNIINESRIDGFPIFEAKDIAPRWLDTLEEVDDFVEEHGGLDIQAIIEHAEERSLQYWDGALTYDQITL